MAAHQIIPGISVLFGLLVFIASVWLLIVALDDDYCRDFERVHPSIWRSTHYLTDTRHGYGYFSRRPYDVRYGAGRGREDYCINVVDSWTLASGIGIAVGIFQFGFSLAYYLAGRVDIPAKIWSILWIIGHIILFIGVIISLIIAIGADLFSAYSVRLIGPIFAGSMGANLIMTILLPVLICLIVVPKSSELMSGAGSGRGSSYAERPDSRTEFIPKEAYPVKHKQTAA